MFLSNSYIKTLIINLNLKKNSWHCLQFNGKDVPNCMFQKHYCFIVRFVTIRVFLFLNSFLYFFSVFVFYTFFFYVFIVLRVRFYNK